MKGFSALRIAVVGDFCLDQYAKCELRGVSPERTVLRIAEGESEYVAGAAANLAVNMASLGAEVHAFGVIGDDENGKTLSRLLAEREIETSGLQIIAGQRTTTYKRYVRGDDGSHDHILRVDHEPVLEGAEGLTEALLSGVTDERKSFDAIFMSDYNEGDVSLSLVSKPFVQQVVTTTKDREKKPYIAGSSRIHSVIMQGLDSLYLNNHEAADVVIFPDSIATTPKEVASTLREQLNLNQVFLTLGGDGAIFSAAAGSTHVPALPVKQIVDPCGCGDSFAACSLLAHLSGANGEEAVELGSAAAASIIGIEGTIPASLEGVAHQIFNQNEEISEREKVLSNQQLSGKVQEAGDKTVVLAVGCFDKLDAGQIRFLRNASALGDLFVVAINSDRSVKQNKGEDRPIHPETDRLEVLSCIDFIDYITVFDELTDINIIRQIIRPGDIHVKGFPYEKEEDVVGYDVVKQLGGKLVLLGKQ
ncbi:MAG: PfkB family carbohydrate kinase [Verrucomicrobiota bacterium]